MKVPSYFGAIKSIFCEGWGYSNQKHISGNVFTLPFKVLWLLLTSLFFLTIRIMFMAIFPISALLVLHIHKKEYAHAKEFFENPSKYF
jgi:hypothetical protein